MSKKEEIIVLDGHLQNTHLVQKSEPLLLMRTVPFELGELKILDTYLARINSRNDKCRTVTFTKEEYEQLMGLIDIRPSTLKKYLKSMLQKVVEVPTENGYKLFSLFTGATCEKDEYGQRVIELTCSEEAKQLFFGIEQLGYLQYELKNILSLTSKYSFLLYLYLRKERYRSDWTIPLAELREQRLDIKNNKYYETFKRFNDDILKKAVAEINNKTDIKFTYSTVKIGRRVTQIRFQLIKELQSIDENQLSFDEIQVPKVQKQNYSDHLSMLAEACNNIFSEEEMQVIFDIIVTLDIPTHPNGIDFARYHYLKQKYSEMQLQSKKRKITNTFAYFKAMLK